MIDNVILLLTGTLHERDTRELLEKCHPLGKFQSLATLGGTPLFFSSQFKRFKDLLGLVTRVQKKCHPLGKVQSLVTLGGTPLLLLLYYSQALS